LAAFASRLGPPGYTHRPARNLIPRPRLQDTGSQDTPGVTTFSSLPSRVQQPYGQKGTGCRGSNPICCLPFMARKAKSGLHPSMQAMRLSRWTNLR